MLDFIKIDLEVVESEKQFLQLFGSQLKKTDVFVSLFPL